MNLAKSLLVYDFLLVKGGAEALSIDLCSKTENMELLVSFIEQRNFSHLSLSANKLHSLRKKYSHPVLQALFISRAFESTKFDFCNYEKVIFSGSYAPLAVNNSTFGCNILYCHTPPRFVYDLKYFYLNRLPFWQRPFLQLLIRFLKPKYEHSVRKMDLVIANSVNVKRRLKNHLNQDSIVIYPPCHIDKYQWKSQGDYYLSTARVEPFKRIKLIVKAFMIMPDKKLIVASGGSELEELKQLATGFNNITFTGWCDEQVLIDLVNNCIATIYLPIDEDFGISPVESMAAGKPVIGVNEGGVKETVLQNKTGILCPESPKICDVVFAVEQLTEEYAIYLRENCIERAKAFSAQIFIEKMQALLNCKDCDLVTTAKEVDAS
ncbi:glycosyltransferase [Litorilituus lipolyticus]|uniref:glycosyltransferase n=1 Tax=Litorilituus lipolyticus TaxID=2491017 RepID=UPI0014781AC5|nr:glycosyltransferase [Litorilituus lipolyticus]